MSDPIASTSEPELRVRTDTTDEINRVFSLFNRVYEKSYLRYARLNSYSEESWLQVGLKDVLAMPEHAEGEYRYPKFMRDFLGYGIVHSFSRDIHPDKRIEAGNQLRSTKVGHALSRFHTAMRNVGKDWNFNFAPDRLTPDLLHEKALVEISSSGKSFDTWLQEFREILTWMELQDTPKARKTPLEKPLCYKEMTDDKIREDLLERFAALKEVPVNVRNKRISIPNEPIRVERTEYFDADVAHHRYDVPAAALVWTIKPGGNYILTRPEGSIVKEFLKHVLGVGDEAGRKISVLQNLFRKHAPHLAELDYDREFIRGALDEQKFWIKTAAQVEKILGVEQNYDEYKSVLQLINESPLSIRFASANKAAVLLHTIVERMKSDREMIVKKNAPPAVPGITERVAFGIIKRFDLDGIMEDARGLAFKLAEAGFTTEDELEKAKAEYHNIDHARLAYKAAVGKTPIEEERRLKDQAQYKIATAEIFASQEVRLKSLLKDHPEYVRSLNALEEYFASIQSWTNIDSEAMFYINSTLKYCREHIPVPPLLPLRPGLGSSIA